MTADAIRRPFTQQKWNDFLALSPWFAGRRDFLRDAVQRFRATGRLAVATYGVSQDAAMVAEFGPTSTPLAAQQHVLPLHGAAGIGRPSRTEHRLDHELPGPAVTHQS